MNSIHLQHNVILPGEDISEIQFQAAIADNAGALTPFLLSIIYKHKLFSLHVPAVSGGKEMQLPDAVCLLEYLSSLDGAFGWTVTLCSGANWFIGFLEKETSELFFSDKRVCLAGSGAITGQATVTDGGYIIDGRWKYATGAPYATAFTANCVLQKDGNTLLDEDGNRTARSFIFRREEVMLFDDWRTTGMRATASQSFEVNNVFVPEGRCFSIDAGHIVLPDAVYSFPFLQFAEVTIAINFCGMATHFTSECRVLFERQIKDKAYSCAKASEMLEALGRAISIIEGKRFVFYETLVDVWEKGKANKNWNSIQLQQLSTNSLLLAKTCLRAVDDLYPYCGMSGADETTVINRIWRDIHTASQHELMKFLYA